MSTAKSEITPFFKAVQAIEELEAHVSDLRSRAYTLESAGGHVFHIVDQAGPVLQELRALREEVIWASKNQTQEFWKLEKGFF